MPETNPRRHGRSGGSTRTLETVKRACEVIEALEELDGAGVTDVAEYVDISKSSAHSYLTTLLRCHFLVKDGTTYRLSLQHLYLGEYVRHAHPLFINGQSVVDRLAEETGEFAHLMCEQHGLERNIYKSRGENAIDHEYYRVKQRRPDYLHFTASGKAVLAFLPETQVREIVDQYGLVAKTENTLTDLDALLEELAVIRERGYAINNEEEIRGVRAVGAPIRGSDGDVLGSVSLSGPTSRFSGDRLRETFPDRVLETANVIEANVDMATTRETL